MPILDLNNKPEKYCLNFEGLNQNTDGLIKVIDFKNHLQKCINEYDELKNKYN